MIKIFRKSRQKIVAGNQASSGTGKFSKPASPIGRYLLYAIGEIALVVIGILIALQINTWNEEVKDRELEQKILLEIKGNLEMGIADYNLASTSDSSCISSGLIVLEYLKNNLEYNDTLNYHFGIFPQVSLSNVPSSGYESLKSIGLSIISNDTIRMKVSNIYGLYLPRLLRTYETDVIPRRTEFFNSELYQHFLVKNSILGDSIHIEGNEPVSYDSLIHDIRFESMVRSLVLNRIWFTNEKKGVQNYMIASLRKINEELENKGIRVDETFDPNNPEVGGPYVRN